MPKSKLTIDTDLLRARLKLKNTASERKLLETHPTAAKFFEEKGLRPGKIREHATTLLTSGVLAGSLLLSGLPAQTPTPVQPTAKAITLAIPQQLRSSLKTTLSQILPQDIRTLNSTEELKVNQVIKDIFGLNAVASLDGNKLNDDYGRMGAEQHLPRFPGDTAEQHGELIDKGITPGLGGWGYVGDFEVEKYYVAVQTLYLPNWKTDTARLVQWYKYRRVVVVNPANGKTIVAAVADAGPSDFTGKKFGGSPELMAYLGINYGMQNHPVVLFFLDDPQKKVPFGPVEYNVETGNPVLANQI